LTESKLEVRKLSGGTVATADSEVDLWIDLGANGRTNEPPACFFQRQAGADDLRRLLAGSRLHLDK
jgi:hypothetical protein